MSWQAPNLARRAFVNLRPLRRVSALFSAVAVLFTAWNVQASRSAGLGAERVVADLTRIERETEVAAARLATIERDLGAFDLTGDNRKTLFLNARIEERSFSWNLLLTRLAEAEPRGVRIVELSPRFATRAEKPTDERRPTLASRPGPASRSPVGLQISGEAEDDEALLDFVDRLFAHPAFDSPKLERESRTGSGTLQFGLTTTYLPEPAG